MQKNKYLEYLLTTMTLRNKVSAIIGLLGLIIAIVSFVIYFEVFMIMYCIAVVVLQFPLSLKFLILGVSMFIMGIIFYDVDQTTVG